MKNFKLTKNLFNNQLFLISFFSLLSCLAIFISFQFKPQDLFICDEYRSYFITLLGNDLNFIYPLNKCDDKVYFAVLEEFQLLFENAARPYQNRPLWLLPPYFIYQLLSNFEIFVNKNILNILSYFITQLSFSILTLNLLINLFKKYIKLNNFDIFSIVVIFYLNPIIQFFVFTPSNGSLSFMVLILNLYFLDKYSKKDIGYSSFLIMGFLFLLNRSFITCLASLFLFKMRFKFKYFLEIVFGTVIFFIPNYLYKFFITFRGYEPYDINTEMYGQFIWLSKYFDQGIFYWFSKFVLSKNNFNLRLTTKWDSDGEWYCQNIPDNFICFFSDMINTSKYLWIPCLILLLYIFFYYPKKTSQLSKLIFIISIVNIFFWSLIGWYPPLRFSLFSFGNVIILYLIYILINHDSLKLKSIILSSVIFGLLNINHWNNEILININILNQISFFLLFFYVYEMFKYRKIKT
tara:strand:+ start:1082 stop:2470 length:1389 start_codon:yes stop_codon:yes gene_type:complete